MMSPRVLYAFVCVCVFVPLKIFDKFTGFFYIDMKLSHNRLLPLRSFSLLQSV